MSEKIHVVCPECGCPNVSCDATARWSYESQAWEISSTFDNRDCDDCGYEGDAFDEVTDDNLTDAQRATIYDNAEYEVPGDED